MDIGVSTTNKHSQPTQVSCRSLARAHHHTMSTMKFAAKQFVVFVILALGLLSIDENRLLEEVSEDSKSKKIQQRQPRVDILDFIDDPTQDFLVLGKQDFRLTNETKVFLLTPHKSGTSSVAAAFEQMKLIHDSEADYYQGLHVKCLANVTCPTTAQFNEFMMEKLKGQRGPTGYEDSPWNHGDCYKQIQATVPDALFVLNVREPSDWIKSFTKWTTVTMRDPYKMASYQGLIQTNYGRIEVNNESYVTNLDQEEWLQNRLQRDQEIVDYFTGYSTTTTTTTNHSQHNLPLRGCSDFAGPPFLNGTSTLLLVRSLSWRPFKALGFSVPRRPFPSLQPKNAIDKLRREKQRRDQNKRDGRQKELDDDRQKELDNLGGGKRWWWGSHMLK